MNRIQVANHEKTESIRSELRNFVRKFDAIAAVITNIDTSINQLKLNAGETLSSGKRPSIKYTYPLLVDFSRYL